MKARIEVGGRVHDVLLEPDGDGWLATVDGESFSVRVDRRGAGLAVVAGGTGFHVGHVGDEEAVVDGAPIAYRVLAVQGVAGAAAGPAGPQEVRPPMTGRVESVRVQEGQDVEAGDVLFVLEAMKMRNEVRAPCGGRIVSVLVQAGATVGTSQAAVVVAPPA